MKSNKKKSKTKRPTYFSDASKEEKQGWIRQEDYIQSIEHDDGTPGGICTNKKDVIFMTHPFDRLVRAYHLDSLESDGFDEVGKHRFSDSKHCLFDCCIQAVTDRLIINFSLVPAIHVFEYKIEDQNMSLELKLAIRGRTDCIASNVEGHILREGGKLQAGVQILSEQGELIRTFGASKTGKRIDRVTSIHAPPSGVFISDPVLVTGVRHEGKKSEPVLQVWDKTGGQCIKEVPWQEAKGMVICADMNQNLHVINKKTKSIDIYADLDNVEQPTESFQPVSDPICMCVDKTDLLFVADGDELACRGPYFGDR